jgi:microcystin degradation protein MlrC
MSYNGGLWFACHLERTARVHGTCGRARHRKAKIVVIERTHEPWNVGVFESVGIDPRGASCLLLKSRMYCRPVFVPIAPVSVERDSRGVTSSHFGLFKIVGLRRPLYSLDPEVEG